MEKKKKKYIFLISSILIGLLIAFSPVIVTGSWYDIIHVMGDLLVAEFIIRTLAIITGLLTVYNGVVHFLNIKSKND